MVSSDSDDDVISYGTPLEPLEEDEIPLKKPRLLEDQIVTDKQGRRRFHGAFTGGFSAGFFNTVGSLEGWTPSAFKSSKSQKQQFNQKRPEDFMDEEDLSEFGIAPVVLKAKQVYSSENRREIQEPVKVSTLGTYVFQNLFKPLRETVGIKLLKKMGWKPGQGVGPRLNKTEKKITHRIRQKTYGCELPSNISAGKEDSEEESGSEWEELDLAPNDYEPVMCEARANVFGLGYEGLDKRPILGREKPQKTIIRHEIVRETNKKPGFSSQAFGVGAFEEEDEDIYLKDDMSRYDFSLGDDPSAGANKTIGDDVVGVLTGFVPEKNKRSRKTYTLPKLPLEFKARHGLRRSRFDQPPNEVKPSRVLNSEQRSKLVNDLSEEVLESKKREKDETNNLIANVSVTESKFRPFASDPDKQERYEKYLKLAKIGQKDRLAYLQPLSMTEWDREREKAEFEKAASLFKPLSGGMEDRFLTASQPDDLSDPLAVVEKFADENDDRRKAAKMNMFGPLTRETEDWVPCSLLCKRFNIPEPKHEREIVQKKKEKPRFNLFDAIGSFEEKKTEKVEPPPKKESPKKEEVVKTETKLPVETEAKSKTDLFKAIFLASDDEEEEEEEKKEEEENISEKTTEVQDLYEEKLINSKRNLSPPSGIFENLDLDALAMRREPEKRTESRNETRTETRTESKTETRTENKTETRTENKTETEQVNPPPDLLYGPKLPEKIGKKINLPANEDTEDGGVWVEKKIHDRRKEKKKKEKKHKKEKSKHKHKKHKR